MSAFRLPTSLYGTVAACVELRAVGPDGQRHIVTVEDDGFGDEEMRAAVALAKSVSGKSHGT